MIDGFFNIFQHPKNFRGKKGEVGRRWAEEIIVTCQFEGKRKDAVLFYFSFFGAGVARSNEWKRWSCQKFGNPRAFVRKSKKSRFFAFIRPAIQSATENGFSSSPYFPHVMKNTFFPKTLLLAVLHLGNVFLLSGSGFKRWGSGSYGSLANTSSNFGASDDARFAILPNKTIGGNDPLGDCFGRWWCLGSKKSTVVLMVSSWKKANLS